MVRPAFKAPGTRTGNTNEPSVRAKHRPYCATGQMSNVFATQVTTRKRTPALLGPLPQRQSLSAARLSECDGFFGFDRCFIDVESKSNSVGRIALTLLWLDWRFQQLLIGLVKYGQHLAQHNKDGVLHVLKVRLYCLFWYQVA